MSSNPENHRARLDAEGNIILPSGEQPIQKTHVREEALELPVWSVPSLEMKKSEEVEQEVISMEEDDFDEFTVVREQPVAYREPEPMVTPVQIKEVRPSSAVRKPLITLPTIPLPQWQDIQKSVTDVSSSLRKEGAKQYRSVFTVVKQNGVLLVSGATHSVQRVSRFLAQPVWVPGKHSAPKKRSRGMLFVTDVVRFGGTFATLFAVLFLTLNYQSFWEIVKAGVDPLSQTQAQNVAGQELADTLGAKLKHLPSLAIAGQSNSDLLSFLPPVGPPDDRLVIPKLNLNAPIVIPSNDALMREDWKKLEEDIQTSLQDGVVHYPGTAKPGQAGNFFLTGHSSYFPWAPGAFKSIFARLHQLEVGDEYWVFYGGDKHRFRVTVKKEVLPSDVSVLDQPLSKRISTLMTCTPVGTTLRRLIIQAEEIDSQTGEPLEVGEHEKRDHAPAHKLESLPI